MVTQFNDQADIRLNAWEQLLGNEKLCTGCQRPKGVVPAQERLEQEYKDLFISIFAEFDRNGLEGRPARFICNDGYTLARQITDPEERIDETLLQAAVLSAANGDRQEAEKLWRSITDVTTTRTVNQAKLAKAIKAGKLKPEIVKRTMVKPKSVTSRHRRKATKEDMEFLKQTGDLSELLVETKTA